MNALKISVQIWCKWMMKGYGNDQKSQKVGKIRKVGKKVHKMRLFKVKKMSN